jgi:hypothetical protein
VSGLNSAHGLRRAGETGPHAVAQQPAAHGQSWPNPAVLTTLGAGATRWVQSPRGAHARGGAVAHRPRARRRLTCHKGSGRVHRARWEMAWLTEEVGHRWGGGERPAWRRSDGGGRSDDGWRCSTLPCGSMRGRKR